MAAVSRCHFLGLPLKYRNRYSRSRHCCCFCYLESDTLDRTLLFRPLLCERWVWIHQNRRCHSNKWDAVNVLLPNTLMRVLSHVYLHQTHFHAYLLPSSSAFLITIRVFFVFPIIPPLCRISDHIFHVSDHCRPPCL